MPVVPGVGVLREPLSRLLLDLKALDSFGLHLDHHLDEVIAHGLDGGEQRAVAPGSAGTEADEVVGKVRSGHAQVAAGCFLPFFCHGPALLTG